MIKKLSVIVPVYKVEKYIRPCIESIFNQGLSDDDYELIIVNDGTPDRSMEQITDLLEQHSNAIVINQENQGVAVARNSGLAKATGEYVLFFDSDDIMIEGSLKLMLDKALESQVDMVVGEHVEMNDEEIDAMSHPIVQPLISWKEHTSRQFFLYTDYKNGAGMPVIWRILYRREFLVDNTRMSCVRAPAPWSRACGTARTRITRSGCRTTTGSTPPPATRCCCLRTRR